MSARERDEAWSELVTWVTWLHDRYELATESRLPDCWVEHPGIIEELWALMIWRREIYEADDQQVGQAARYWHSELKSAISNVTTFYAASCRTGHMPAGTSAATNAELQARWAAANPWVGVPHSALKAGDDADVPVLDAHSMQNALADGRAQPLSAAIPDYVRHEDAWWAVAADGHWTQVTSAEFSERLDEAARRMTAAETAADRRRTRPTHTRPADQPDARNSTL